MFMLANGKLYVECKYSCIIEGLKFIGVCTIVGVGVGITICTAVGIFCLFSRIVNM